MPAKRHYSAYQKNIIKNYYENRGAIHYEKLQTLVSELYLAKTDKRRDALWLEVAKLLLELGVHAADVDYITQKRDLNALGREVNKLF